MQLGTIIRTSLISGTVAAVAMMPFGFAFRSAGMRIGHYGPKFAALYMDEPAMPALFIQHLVIGWFSALPLVLFMVYWRGRTAPVLVGALYGAAYYVAINSLALPLYFGDELPWTLGIATIVPSLTIHVVFGMVVGYFCRSLARS